MKFEELREKINGLNCESREALKDFESTLEITGEDFNELAESIFSDKVQTLDLNKLPYAIDALYQTNDQLRFMVCCMLIEATCFDLPFMTNLENYPLFEAKYETLKHTLLTVYDAIDSGIANCMTLIILNNDPTFQLMESEEKEILVKATNRKLKEIIEFLKTADEINSEGYREVELIIDLATYMDDEEIDKQIEELQTVPLNFSCQLFIAKYKLVNKKNISQNEIEKLIQNRKEIERVVSIFENNGGNDLLKNMQITQEEIALSNMISWLEYPTELGKEPDEIILAGTFENDDGVVYVYKFRSDVFPDRGYMIGISGAYAKNTITAKTSGNTFSKFETIQDDFIKQGKEIVEFIEECWRKRAQEQ